jgi:dihydroflavonol-4-reductase
MRAALAAGVGRIVYTSSVATLKPSTTDRRRNLRRAPEEAVGAYKRSKVVAERLVEDMVERDGLPAVIVQPSTPIGPRDVRPTRPAASSSRPPTAACPPMSIPG